MSRMYLISEEVLARASRLKESGRTWNAIGRELGLPPEAIRWRIDPQYVAAHRESHGAGQRRVIQNYTYRMTAQEAQAALSSIPSDTRNFTARAFGDPLPGRSAFDKRRAQSSVQSSSVIPTKIYNAQGRPSP